MSARTRLPGWLVALAGPFVYALRRLGEEYAMRRELAKADVVGEGVNARPGLFVTNMGKITIGKNVSFGAGCELTTYPGGSIEIGDNVFFAKGCVVASEKGRVVIGDDGLIAEDVTIRAADHGMRPDQLMRLQPNEVRDIVIGKDVWIGKGVAVIAGTTIADGCVIGANAVARGETEAYGIYAGVPIRKIGDRRERARAA